MKLLKLRLKNLNSFRQEVNLDFDSAPMNETSLLAITGPTGSGKTTLLDALCVALYNKTPRLSGVGAQNPGNLLSQGKTEGFAEVFFEADGTRYLTEWSVKRNRKGELKQEAKLINTDTGVVVTDRLSSRSRSNDTHEMSVSGAVQTILGLDFDAFSRSVMLAQGQFAAFLKAKAEERRTILEATTGIGMYDTLKKTLNEKVNAVKREYEQVEAAFNAIPATSQEEIHQVQVQIGELDTKYRSLQQKRREIMEQKDAESQRARAYKQLTEAEERQRKLLSQRAEMDEVQAELDAARRAADLRLERQTFDTEKEALQAAETTLAETQCGLNEAQSDYDESQKKFIEIEAQYQSAAFERSAKIPVFNRARDKEIRAQAQFDEAEKRKAELQTVEKAVDQLTRHLGSQQEDKAKLEEQIESDRRFLDAHPLPADSDQCLVDAKTILVTLHGGASSHREKSKAQEELGSKSVQLRRKSEDLEGERIKLLEKKESADAALIQAEAELNALLAGGDADHWGHQKEDAQRLQPIAREYEDAVRRRRAAQEKLDPVREALNSAEVELADLNQTLESQTKDVALAEEKVKRYEAEEKYALMANHVIALREDLQAGQPCPVCGATEHPWTEKEELEGEKQIELAQRNLAEAKAALQIHQNHLSDLRGKSARAEVNNADLERRLNDLRETIEALEGDIASTQAKWQEISPDTEISSQMTQEMINKADAYIQNLHKAKTAYTDASHQGKLIEQRLNSHDREIQSVKANLAEIEGQRQEIDSDLAALNREIEEMEAQFWETLPDGFHGEKPGDALEQFEEQINAVRACEKRRNDKMSLLHQLSGEIESNLNQLESEGRRKAEVEAEIARYQAEGNRLFTSAHEKTGGLTADEAIQKLERDLQDKAEGRELTQRTFHETRNLLTQAQSKLDNANSHFDVCRQKFSAAQRAYLDALENAGFVSPEEHERAFRDESWLATNQAGMQQYQRDLYATELEVATHRATFVDSPLDPEAMDRLQDAEQEIDDQIDSITQEIGGLREKQQKLQAELKQREAQGHVLEKVRREKESWERLQECIPENSLRDFALERMFDLMIRLANKQLDDLTHRYELKVKGMRDMVVIDKWNANEERPVETLSGGESFLTSLALALALSEMSRGRTQLNSLFLDEGFGTLDSQTLDIAISALEGLRFSGKNVFVISHVEELTRRIPVRIAVEKTGNGSSQVKIQQ